MSILQSWAPTPAPSVNPFHAPAGPASAPAHSLGPLAALTSPLTRALSVEGKTPSAAPAFGSMFNAPAAHHDSTGAVPLHVAPTAAARSDGSYHSPYSGAFMAGIGTGTDGALSADRIVNGRGPGYGYAAYAPSPTDAQAQVSATASVGPFSASVHKNVTIPYSSMDTVGDIAAVTQYAAAADQGVKLDRGPDGKPVVNVDWQKLSETPIQANLDFQTHGHDLPGAQKITYDNPSKVAQNGQQAILDNLQKSGKDPRDKDQFISITGHSGGGQSSFYTALKMASDGYKNVSVVGVDMAMTPHERQVLETMGVQVTNITSNNTDDKGTHTSEIGEFIKTGMGGGDNYYDLNVQRQNQTDAPGRHGITNDANVTTTVRFAQYLDANGKHGQYSPELYQKFLDENPGGNVLTPEGNNAQPQTADSNLLCKTQDNRGKAGPQPRTEKDFQDWFRGYIKNASTPFMPLPNESYGVGPLSINPAQWAAGQLGDLAANNDAGLVDLLQRTGIDTSHISGLEKYNSGNVSNHWGQLNPIDIPLPDWLDINKP